MDSMQIYRYMNIGTAKPSKEERQRVPHHLIDFINPDQEYHVARFVEDAQAACRIIIRHGKRPFLVGGTGLYLKGLTEGLFDAAPADQQVREELKTRLDSEGRETLYEQLQRCDPLSAERIHPNDTQRLLRALEVFETTGVPWSLHIQKQVRAPAFERIFKIGLTCEREKLYERINLRVNMMVEEGLLDEVESILALGYGPNLKSMQSIGYRHTVNYLNKQWTWEQTLELLARDTRRYAKRQYTWFNNDPDIQWFDVTDQDGVLAAVQKFYDKDEEGRG